MALHALILSWEFYSLVARAFVAGAYSSSGIFDVEGSTAVLFAPPWYLPPRDPSMRAKRAIYSARLVLRSVASKPGDACAGGCAQPRTAPPELSRLICPRSPNFGRAITFCTTFLHNEEPSKGRRCSPPTSTYSPEACLQCLELWLDRLVSILVSRTTFVVCPPRAGVPGS